MSNEMKDWLTDTIQESQYNANKLAADYCHIIVKTAEKNLGLTWEDAARAVIRSGISEIVYNDPVVASHLNPEEWMENLEAYLKTANKTSL